MLVEYPLQYIYGAIFFPSLFLILHVVIRRTALKKKVPISNKVIDQSDVWEISANLFCSSQAVISTICGFVIVLNCYDFLHDRYWLANAYARFGMSYFVVDTMVMMESCHLNYGNGKTRSLRQKLVKFVKKRPLMTFHHVFLPCIMAPIILVFRRNLGDYAVGALYIMEFTIPFIQFRHLLNSLKLNNTRIYFYNGLAMIFTFVLCRIGIFIFLYFKYAAYRDISVFVVPASIPKCCVVGTVLILVPQFIWTHRMLKGLFHIVTSTYSILATIFGLIIINSVKDIMSDNHWLTKAWARFGISYYYYDTVVKIEGLATQRRKSQESSKQNKVIAYIRKDPLMFAHHVVLPSVFYPVIIYFRHDVGDFFVGCFYAFEFVVPFIQFRHILYRLELKSCWIYVINGIFMTVAFAVCRVAFFPYLYLEYANFRNISVWTVPSVIPMKCTISCAVIMSMQVYWFSIMVRGVIVFFMEKKTSEKIS